MVDIISRGKRKYYINDDKKIYITDTEGNKIYFSDKFVDIAYASRNSVSCALSNLFPYNFGFRGYQVESIEGILQSLKHQAPEVQRMLYSYYGKDAYHARAGSFVNDWRETHQLYCGTQVVDRFSVDYQNLLNEIYICASRNPLYANTLIYTGNRTLLHSTGVKDPNETILTPSEYIDRLTIIRDSLIASRSPVSSLDDLSETIVSSYKKDGYVKK